MQAAVALDHVQESSPQELRTGRLHTMNKGDDFINMDVESAEQITVDDGASGGIDNKDNDFEEVGLQ